MQRQKTRWLSMLTALATALGFMAPAASYGTDSPPSVRLSPDSVIAGYANPVTVNVTGTNTHFDSGNFRVTIKNSNGQDESSYVSSATGTSATSGSFVLNSGLGAGSYTVTVTDQTDGPIAAPFSVQPSPVLSPSQTNVGYSSPVTVNVTGTGTHFDNSFAVALISSSGQDVSSYVSSTSVTDATHASFVVNTGLPRDAYTVYVSDTTDGKVNSGTFAVLPTATISPQGISAGYSQPVTIAVTGNGTRFDPSFQVRMYDNQNNQVFACSVNESSCNVTVTDVTHASFTLTPGLPQGVYTVAVFDTEDTAITHGNGVYAGTFTVGQSVSISPTSVTAGYMSPIPISVTGEGTNFASTSSGLPSFKVTVKDSNGNTLNTAVWPVPPPSASDNTHATFDLAPGLSVGVYTVYVSDAVDGTLSAGSFTVLANNASATIRPDSEPAGYSGPVTIDVTGQNTHFTKHFKVALKDSNNNDLTSPYVGPVSVSSDTAASFPLNSGLPAGSYTVNITDDLDGTLPPVPFTVRAANPSVNLYPDSAPSTYNQPIPVTVTGSGTHFYNNGNGNFAVKVYNSNGTDITQSAVFPVPPPSASDDTHASFELAPGLAAGSYAVVVSDALDGNLPPVPFTVFTPYATLSVTQAPTPYPNPISETMTGYGTHFKSSPGFAVKVTDMRGNDVTSQVIVPGSLQAQSDTSATFQIATGLAGGEYLFTASDLQDGNVSAGSFTVALPSAMVLTGNEPTVDITSSATVSSDSSGNMTVKLNSSQALSQIRNAPSGTSFFTVNAASQRASFVQFAVGNDVLQALGSRSAYLVLAASQGAYEFTPDMDNAIANNDSHVASVTVTIGTPDANTTSSLSRTVSDRGLTAVGNPLQFSVAAQNTDSSTAPLTFYDSYGNGTVYSIAVIDLGPAKVDSGHAVVLFHDAVTGQWEAAPTWFTASPDGAAAILYRPADGADQVVQADKTFSDIQGHWAQQNIETMASKQYVFGETSTLFAPDHPITRAEFAAEIVRALGVGDFPGAGTSFSDVSSNDWYYHVVSVAQALGIVKGYNGQFNPNQSITRQDIATMVARAIRFIRPDETADSSVLNRFSDAGQIASYAVPGAAVCVNDGIIQGETKDTFRPLWNATRAEATTMVERMMAHLQLLDTN
jgi:hypothetical protein